MHPPRWLVEQFVRGHPVQAVLMLIFWLAMMVYTGWIIITGP